MIKAAESLEVFQCLRLGRETRFCVWPPLLEESPSHGDGQRNI